MIPLAPGGGTDESWGQKSTPPTFLAGSVRP